MAGSGSNKPTDTYSPVFGFVYIFNLVIGVGALSLPKAFSQAGLILGTLLLFMLAFMSYMTATFMIEAMAIANALVRLKPELRETRKLSTLVPKSPDIQKVDESLSGSASYGATNNDTTSETARLVPAALEPGSVFTESDDHGSYISPDDYEIKEKFEMGTMANLFYHPIGVFLYYVVICLYLYGDLAIYAVAIPKSIIPLACQLPLNSTDAVYNQSSNVTELFELGNATTTCFGPVSIQQAYYLFLSITLLLLCPWTFFNLTKSKYLQLTTTILRNIAFALMVGIAVSKLAQGNVTTPSAASLEGFPLLFGVSIYSFMCQHSLPGMVTPMRTKRGIFVLIASDFGLILAFYLLLSYTGAFWLSKDMLNELYTLNFFIPFAGDAGERFLSFLGYYLALFPVFTLSTNFPIISITLRENLKALGRVLLKRWIGDTPYPWAVDRLLFPILALIIPIAIAYGTQKVELLISITGSFPGIGVQYVIPVTLAFCGKYVLTKRYGQNYENKYKSPFSYLPFLVFVLIWTGISVILIIVDDAIKIANGTFLD